MFSEERKEVNKVTVNTIPSEIKTADGCITNGWWNSFKALPYASFAIRVNIEPIPTPTSQETKPTTSPKDI